MKNQTYIRCPRCELNYILKKDKFCNVCKQEMKALGTLGAEENLDMELCPICKVNYINPDEGICFSCAKERETEDGEVKFNNDSDWNGYATHEDEDINFEDEETGDMASITNLDDGPLGDEDDMDLGLADDDEEPVDEDETFDSDFDETFDDLDEDADDDFDDDDDDEIDDDDENEVSKKKRKK